MRYLLAVLFFGWTQLLTAQFKPLELNDLVQWQYIKTYEVSPKGNYLYYEVTPHEGDSYVVLHTFRSQKNDTIPLGSNAEFGVNESYFACVLKVPFKTTLQEELNETKKDDKATESLIIVRLPSFERDTFLNYEGHKAPQNFEFDELLLIETKAQKEKEQEDSKKKKKRKSKTPELPKFKGNDLHAYTTKNGEFFTLKNVDEYQICNSKNVFAITRKAHDKKKKTILSQIEIYKGSKTPEFSFSDSIYFERLAVSNSGEHFAVLTSKDTLDDKNYVLSTFDFTKAMPTISVDSNRMSIYKDFTISKNQPLEYSLTDNWLYFGIAPKRKPEPKDTIPNSQKAKFDLWHYNDAEIMPQQLKKVQRDLKQTYLVGLDLRDNKISTIEDTVYDSSRLSRFKTENGAFLFDSKTHFKSFTWSGEVLYNVQYKNLKSHTKTTLFTKAAVGQYYMSDSLKIAVFFNETEQVYYGVHRENLGPTKIATDIPYPLVNQKHDTPSKPWAYGVAFFDEANNWVYIYDEFDIWRVDAFGKQPSVCVTNGYGRKNNVQLRLRYSKSNSSNFSPTEQLVLLGVNQQDYSSQLVQQLVNGEQQKVMFNQPVMISRMQQAVHSNKLIYSVESFENAPELVDFESTTNITDFSWQTKPYNWPTCEVIQYPSSAGDTMNALLIKPKNFDAKKSYPTIIYYYEQYSDMRNKFFTPRPSRSIINFPHYASNEYIIVVPDIKYNTGYPGKDATNAIVGLTQYLIRNYRYINREKIGLQGQSWGGYQTAYVITQTNMFAAAMAGAPVSNMTSAYGGIRWGSGISRMFQYEHGQSRIGGTLWNSQQKYIENSPVFFADKVTTPLLMMHNDNDGAVPWYQGIEYYMALRRFNKPVWLLNYNNEEHNLTLMPNRKDLTVRMQQFFDHYLKDAPAPEWLEKGRSATQKHVEEN